MSTRRKVIVILIVLVCFVILIISRIDSVKKDRAMLATGMRSQFVDGYYAGYMDGESSNLYDTTKAYQYRKLRYEYRISYEAGYGYGYYDGERGDYEANVNVCYTTWPSFVY